MLRELHHATLSVGILTFMSKRKVSDQKRKPYSRPSFVVLDGATAKAKLKAGGDPKDAIVRAMLAFNPTGSKLFAHETIRLVDHRGEKVLLVDFSNRSANEVEKIARVVPDYVTVNPLASVLVLTDFTRASFDRDALRALKETAVFDKPFVRKAALLGVEYLPTSFYDELKSFSRRELLSFRTREEALDWLVDSVRD